MMNSREGHAGSYSRAGGVTYSIVETGQMIHTTSSQQVGLWNHVLWPEGPVEKHLKGMWILYLW